MGWSSDLSTSNTYIKYRIGITQNSQNVTNNTSNVRVQVWFYRTNTGYETYGTGTVYCKINGTTYSASVTTSQKITNSGVYLFDKTVDVAHNADGSKTLTCSAWIDHSRVTSSEQSYSQVLTTIPRATTPTISPSSVTMGGNITISTPRASSSFTHTLTYTFGSASGTIGTGVTTSKTWTVPTSLASQIPNATSGTGTITCDTYNGSTKIGSKSVNFTATVPSGVVPTISAITLSDPTGYSTTFGGYVQGKSKLKVQVTSAGASGSTIKTIQITALGQTVTTNPWTSNIITVSGSQTVTVKVTDSRNRTATGTATFGVLAYSSPTINKLAASRCDESGHADDGGAYMKITYSGSVSSLNNKNTVSFKVLHKEQDVSTWTTDITITDVYSVNSSIIVPADVNKSYDVSFTVRDYFTPSGQYIEKDWKVSTAYTLMDFRSTGKGIALGKASEKDVLEVALETCFLKGITKSEDNWFDKIGFHWFLYEGTSTASTYNLPTNNCVVVIFVSAASRGVAYACGWATGDNRLWKANLHDDTSKFTWGAWTQVH